MDKRSLMLAAALAATAAITACKKPEPARAPAAPAQAPASAAPAPAAPAGPAFSHDASLEVFGYYLPVQTVSAGPYRLRNLSLGGEDDFRNWEGDHRLPSYGPVMLEFDDTSSPKTTSAETGAEGYAQTIRVLPDRYRVDDSGVSFEGHDDKLGAVSFHGRFDAHGFAAARRGDAPEAVVLTGEVKVGGKSFPDTRFTWFGGD
jgi:hypothetical protein